MSADTEDKAEFWFAATTMTPVSVLTVIFVEMVIAGLHLASGHAAYGVMALGTAGLILGLCLACWISKSAALRGVALGLFAGGTVAIFFGYVFFVSGR